MRFFMSDSIKSKNLEQAIEGLIESLKNDYLWCRSQHDNHTDLIQKRIFNSLSIAYLSSAVRLKDLIQSS